jgi:RNA polymerase primary sigma factor
MPSSKKPAVSVAKKPAGAKPLKAAASPAPAKKSATASKATAATKVKPVPTKTAPADPTKTAAAKAAAPATAKKVGRPPKAAGTATAATGAKRGRKPKAGAEAGEIEEDLSDIEAEFAEEEPAAAGTETATVEKVKPLRMKISKAKERALMKEFGLDETVLSEEDMPSAASA